jgi:hypothetical protein
MKNQFVTASCIILASMFGCNESNEPNLRPDISLYSWTVSEYSPENGFTIYNLKIGDDQDLYAMGYKEPGRIFAKLVNGEWQTIASVDESGILDFTFYNDTIYYTNGSSLKKAKGSFVAPMLSGRVGGLEVFENKLIITGGEPIPYAGNQYTIMSYEGGKKFTPIDSGFQSGFIKEVNNKLFIAGHELKIYDGKKLITSEFGGGFLNVDSNEAIYSWWQTSTNFKIVKFVNNQYQDVGDVINSTAIVNNLEFYQETIVVSAVAGSNDINQSFYLNGDNQWVEVPTAYYILDLINFNGKLFAATNDGVLLELMSMK